MQRTRDSVTRPPYGDAGHRRSDPRRPNTAGTIIRFNRRPLSGRRPYSACTGDFLAPQRRWFARAIRMADAAHFDGTTEVEREQHCATCRPGAAAGHAPAIRPSHISSTITRSRPRLVSRGAVGQTSPPIRGTEGFDNNVFALQVSDTLARDYRRTAEDTVTPSSPTPPHSPSSGVRCPAAQGDTCAADLHLKLVTRVYRRPLTTAEAARAISRCSRARPRFLVGDALTNGVRW